jgi:uncharacterized membrane protein
MHPSQMHYLPLPLPFFSILVVLFVALVLLLQLGAFHFAYKRLGVSSGVALTLLLASLLGSYINIPVAELPAQQVVTGQEVSFFGMHYTIPVVRQWSATVVAVNVGGAVIPILVSLYLLIHHNLWIRGIIGTGIVTAVCHSIAQPIAGLGIALPVFVPAVTTALVAFLLSGWDAAPLAYICGSLGTLIGADLLNLGHIQGLGAPVASIGGAGTFDGIFLTGILAVLIASLAGGRAPMDTRQN